MSPSVYLAALHRLPHMPHDILQTLLGKVPEARDLWYALPEALRAEDTEPLRVREVMAAAAQEDLKALEVLMERKGIRLYTEKDPGFPELSKVENAPVCLYARGDFSLLRQDAIALVGSRRMTPYGQGAVSAFVPPIVQAGLVTVSGLARGVDAAVHKTTLDHGGKTVAVMGTGVDIVYPGRHTRLAETILAKGGLLVSELPLGSQPLPWHFPARNRLIARWAKATVIVEAATASGSLHTAEAALEYGLPVYAVPGSIYSPESAGTNALLSRPEVSPLTVSSDLLECGVHQALPLGFGVTSRALSSSRLLELLTDDPAGVGDLASRLHLSVGACLVELGKLDACGLVTQFGGGWVRRRDNT